MRSFPLLASTAFLCALRAAAQRNITIPTFDPSVKLHGQSSNWNACEYDAEGILLDPDASLPCIIVPSTCPQYATGSERPGSGASFSFKGSAIYVKSYLGGLSPLVTVTLDGKEEDVDGFRQLGGVNCFILFSQTGLDPTVQHNISVIIKDESPRAPPNAGTSLLLTDFVYSTNDTEPTSTYSFPTPAYFIPPSTDTVVIAPGKMVTSLGVNLSSPLLRTMLTVLATLLLALA